MGMFDIAHSTIEYNGDIERKIEKEKNDHVITTLYLGLRFSQ